jgi:hypothetical protein
MAKTADKRLRDFDLSAAVAEKIFGWRDVRKVASGLVGKKQDKLGRWRSAKVPDYARDAAQGYAIDQKMKQLSKATQYAKELTRIAKTQNLPPDWATPELRARAALQVMRLKIVK